MPQPALLAIESGGARRDQPRSNRPRADSKIMFSEKKRQDYSDRLLEARKAEIEPRTIPLTVKAKAITDQLAAIKRTIRDTDKARRGALLDIFLDRVVPIFEVKVGKDKVRRAFVKGFKFFPKKGMENIMPQAMEIGNSRMGRGSWRRRERNSPGTSRTSGRAR